ncbi:hypothetical protein Acr_26g0010980 [Actinidia rufa]|uniref:DUF659 domain-containing protein n=1 Tax=Actinidia rufa TaxID=165716 RepID=A0A7J0H471_9ERIC|nr:hypothetical protein Acr_26g0010980 [Actinidia rufa]
MIGYLELSLAGWGNGQGRFRLQGCDEAVTAVWDANNWNRTGYKRLPRKPESVMPIDLDGEHLQLTDMDDHNQEDSVSVVNSTVKNEDVEVETRELTATPLKRYVTMVDNGIANKHIELQKCHWTKGRMFPISRYYPPKKRQMAINEAPKGYEPPSSEKIKTSLLDKEKTKVDQALVLIKQQWPTYGVSVVSDGWMNVKNESFIKIMAVSESRAMLISGLDCSRDEVSHEFIAGILLKAVESVGAFNVVQILTDNSPTCKAAGRIIETTYPHIFWTGCVAHTLSLLLKDMVKSMHPCLAFVGNCYNKVKGVTNYLKNHSSSLNIFRMFPELDGFLVKKTRYGQHFLVLERTLRVKNALINMVLSEEWDKLTRGRSKSKMEHETVRKTSLDDDFWKNLRTIVTFMRPIWDLISYCESDRTCIGEVYQRMDDMFGSVKLALPDNADLRGVIQKLVAGRWDKMEILLYSLAYALSPHYHSHSWLSSLAPGGKKKEKTSCRSRCSEGVFRCCGSAREGLQGSIFSSSTTQRFRQQHSLLSDDNLEIDVEAIEERECAVLHSNEVNSAESLPFSTTTSAVSSQTSTQGSSKLPAAEIVCSKKRRLRPESPNYPRLREWLKPITKSGDGNASNQNKPCADHSKSEKIQRLVQTCAEKEIQHSEIHVRLEVTRCRDNGRQEEEGQHASDGFLK